MTTVQVSLGDRSYPIRIRSGSLADLGETLAGTPGLGRVVVVSAPPIAETHAANLCRGLGRAGLSFEQLEVPDGERAKTLRTASRLYDRLIELGCDRQTCMVGLGGGVVCDLTGFVASTFLRGVPLVQVPTTLLAQVDASVGGKTAVNHARGKNLIGSFYQPRLVWIDPDTLATLPAREVRAGMAEVVKVAAIWDAEFFKWLEENLDAVTALEPEALTQAIARACAIKAEVIGLDEREAGLRALLNFGHTLGHAIENVHGYRKIRHGEGVSIGMVFAAGLSTRLDRASAESAERLRVLLQRLGLPTEPPDLAANREAYLQAISVDKKVRDASVGFVVLREIGRAEVVKLTPEEILSGAA